MSKLLFLLFLISLSAKAQDHKSLELVAHLNSVDPILPLGNVHLEGTQWLDGGNYNNKSIALGLTAKHFIEDNVALYIKSIYTNRNVSDYRELYSGNHNIVDVHLKQSIFKISPGIQFSLPYKKLYFLAGFELPITFCGEMTQTSNYFQESLNSTNPLYQDVIYKIPGGIIIGLGFGGGCNYYFHPKFALGFSIGSAFQYTSVGGNLSNYEQTKTEQEVIDTYSTHEETIKQLGFAAFQASINFTYKLK